MVLIAANAQGQAEICGDGIDNDGNGKIDSFDPACASFYGLKFIVEGSNCAIQPDVSNAFSGIGAPFKSAPHSSDVQSSVMVGDIDSDGIPEMVLTSRWTRSLRIIASKDHSSGTGVIRAGTIKAELFLQDQVSSFSIPQGAKTEYNRIGNLTFENEVLLADINRDGFGEVFSIVGNHRGDLNMPGVGFFLTGYTYQSGNLEPLFNPVWLGKDRPGIPGITDFDGDGKAEIFIKNRIYSAEQGMLLADGGGDWVTELNSAPVAVDISGDQKLELVCGNKIYSVPELSSRTQQAISIVKDLNGISGLDPSLKYFPKVLNDPQRYGISNLSSTSVADVNGDGELDVVITGAVESYAGKSAVFYWDQSADRVSVFFPQDANHPFGWPWGAGRVNLSDTDGDGKLNLNFISGDKLFSLKESQGNLISLWSRPRTINDSRSGIMSCTVFDFDNDGNPEIIYRDSRELVVVDGKTGTQKLWSSSCQSHPFMEGPVVADVNDDGKTDLCIPCYGDPSVLDAADGLEQESFGEVRLYTSNGNNWLPSRQVWNQPGYFAAAIRDDLSLPQRQIDQTLQFDGASCQGPVYPLNGFGSQVSIIKSDGCPAYLAPDLAFADNGITVVAPLCGKTLLSVQLNLKNSGSRALNAKVPVSFFKGNPLTNPGTAVRLHSTLITVNDLDPAAVYQTDAITFNGAEGGFDLYVLLYNDGATLPVVMPQVPNSECNANNNLGSVTVSPVAFTVQIEKINENAKCSNSDPDIGALRVRILRGSVEVTDYSLFDFKWFSDPQGTQLISGANGYSLSGLATGTYVVKVYASDGAGCQAVASATINRISTVPEISILIDAHQNSCVPPDGQLTVAVTGLLGNYSISWLDENGSPIGVTTPTAKNLKAGGYKALVSCGNSVYNSSIVQVLPPVLPEVSSSVVSQVRDCSDPASGIVTAVVRKAGVDQPAGDYQFEWYEFDIISGARGSNLPVTSGDGPTRNKLEAGGYKVDVIERATGCHSQVGSTVEVVKNLVYPTVQITEMHQQTSCDPLLPNGVLKAEAFIGNVLQSSNISFDWFRGDNTILPALTTTSGSNGEMLNQVQGGGIIYTVRARTNNNCTASAKVSISENKKIPDFRLTAAPNQNCDISLGYTGQVNASPLNYPVNFSGYEFYWYDGYLVDETKKITALTTSSQLTNQKAGYITAVLKDPETSCYSLPVTTEIKAITISPEVTIAAEPSTNCLPVKGNGIASVTSIGGQPINNSFSYQWYTGIGTMNMISKSLNASADQPALTGLQGGEGIFFTVKVTNKSTGCMGINSVEVPDNRKLPVITVDVSNNTKCVVPFNGSAFVKSIDQNVNFNAADFKFSWTGSSGVNQGVSINNLGVGKYVVTVADLTRGCAALPVEVEVRDSLRIPELQPQVTPQTSCLTNALNGRVYTQITNRVASDTYTFKWYDNGNPFVVSGTLMSGQNTETIEARPGNGFYTVVVQNNDSKCTASKSVYIPEKRKIPRLNLIANDIADCTVANKGFITAQVFTDLNDDGDNADPGDLVTNYSNLEFSWYLGSSAGPKYPETGPVLLDSTGAKLGKGKPIPPFGYITADSIFHANLKGGMYAAIVRDINTGCVSAESRVKLKSPPKLFDIRTTVNISPSSCLSNDGVITAYVDLNGSPTTFGYKFEWFQGNNQNSLTSEVPGFYSIDSLNLGSVLRVDYVDPVRYPGGMSQALGGQGPPPVPQIITGPFSGPTLYGRPSGTYTVVVTNNTTKCKDYLTTFVPFTASPLINQVVVTPADCSGNNGKIESDFNVVSGFSLSDYKLWLIKSANPVLTAGATPVSFAGLKDPVSVNNTFLNLTPGIYSLVGQEDPTGPNTRGCYLPPVRVEIRQALTPLVNVSGLKVNNNCAGASANGEFQFLVSSNPNDPFDPAFIVGNPISIFPSSQNFFVQLKSGSNVIPLTDVNGNVISEATPLASGSLLKGSGLSDGNYNLRVTSAQGCVSNQTVTIQSSASTPEISPDIQIFSTKYCAPGVDTQAGAKIGTIRTVGARELCSGGFDEDGDGLIDLNDPDCNADLTYFNFKWFNNSDLAPSHLILQGLGSNIGTGAETFKNGGTVLPATPIVPGDYFVVAEKLISATSGGAGCKTAPYKVTILDERQGPEFSLVSAPDVSCEVNSNFSGSVRIQVTNSGSLDASSFDYNWPVVPNGVLLSTSSGNGDGLLSDDNINGLKSGSYTLRVANPLSGCYTDQNIFISRIRSKVEILSGSTTPQLICYPDGTALVDPNGLVFNETPDNNPANFEFTWYRNDLNNVVAGPAVGLNQITNQSFAGIGAGNYFVTAKRITGVGNGCTSAPFALQIEDQTSSPRAILELIKNTSCDLALTNGSLRVFTSEQSVNIPAGPYTYDWTLNGADLSEHSDFITSKPAGKYVVNVRNTITGCAFTTGGLLFDDTSAGKPQVVSFNSADPTNCIGNGSIQVTGVSIGGGSVLNGAAIVSPSFEYSWFKESPVPVNQLSSTSAFVSNLAEGKYFVVAKNMTTACVSDPTAISLSNQNLIYPDIKILQTIQQIGCTVGTARLVATADNFTSSNPNYIFSWTGSSISQPLQSVASNLGPGAYHLKVTNSQSGCSNEDDFIIPDRSLQTAPVLAAGGLDQTSCLTANGTIQARIINRPAGVLPNADYNFPSTNFSAELFLGTTSQSLGLMTSNNDNTSGQFYATENLEAGSYTIRVTDENTGCITDLPYVVRSVTTVPDIFITEEYSNANCTPLKSNGQLSASVSQINPDQFAGFVFEWYAGASVTPEEPVIFTGNKLTGREAGTYSVRVTSLETGCFADQSEEIQSTQGNLVPVIELLSAQTNCTPQPPNGLLSANISGVTNGFDFNWFNGDVIGQVPDFTGPIYAGLTSGNYTLTVENLLTRCKSNPITTSVTQEIKLPELKFEIKPSYCVESGKAGTGSILIETVDPETIISNVIWTDLTSAVQISGAQGVQIFDLYPGVYGVEVATDQACTATAEVEVKSEIAPFNGMSKNGDGLNDFFLIDCIANYPNNNVKIYNRYGVKVFDQNGYDNINIFFSGLGLDGLYLQGRELPEGTYFYIVEKGDGSDPVSGYLELTR